MHTAEHSVVCCRLLLLLRRLLGWRGLETTAEWISRGCLSSGLRLCRCRTERIPSSLSRLLRSWLLSSSHIHTAKHVSSSRRRGRLCWSSLLHEAKSARLGRLLLLRLGLLGLTHLHAAEHVVVLWLLRLLSRLLHVHTAEHIAVLLGLLRRRLSRSGLLHEAESASLGRGRLHWLSWS